MGIDVDIDYQFGMISGGKLTAVYRPKKKNFTPFRLIRWTKRNSPVLQKHWQTLKIGFEKARRLIAEEKNTKHVLPKGTWKTSAKDYYVKQAATTGQDGDKNVDE